MPAPIRYVQDSANFPEAADVVVIGAGIAGAAATWELAKQGLCVVVITHDNEIAMEAERVVRIRDGKIVEDYINPGFEEKYGRESKKDNANPIDQG